MLKVSTFEVTYFIFSESNRKYCMCKSSKSDGKTI